MRRRISVIDPETDELVAAAEYDRRVRERRGRHRVGSPLLCLDIPPWQAFTSPIDGSVIDSRESLRRHNAEHGVVDVGDDPALHSSRGAPCPEPEGIEEDLLKAWDQVEAGAHEKLPRAQGAPTSTGWEA